METFVRTTYTRAWKTEAPKEEYPFWDYRSQKRGGNGSKGKETKELKNNEEDLYDDYITSGKIEKNVEGMEPEDERKHIVRDIDQHGGRRKPPLQLIIQCSEEEENILSSLFQPLLNMVQDYREILTFNRIMPTEMVDKCEDLNHIVTVPNFGILLFLQENDVVGSERLATASKVFTEKPWKLHHSEPVSKRNVNAYPYNNMDYYFTGDALPLWAVRQVHTGNEFIRLLQFISDDTWQDSINLYQLIIGHEPDIMRKDFCLFSVHYFGEVFFQFGLKKLPQMVTTVASSNVQLKFSVKSIGNLVPLLPNPCHEVQTNLWQTVDLNGNILLLDVCGGDGQLDQRHVDDQCKKSYTSSGLHEESQCSKLTYESQLDNDTMTHASRVSFNSSVSGERNTIVKTERYTTPVTKETQVPQHRLHTSETKMGFVQSSVQKLEAKSSCPEEEYSPRESSGRHLSVVKTKCNKVSNNCAISSSNPMTFGENKCCPNYISEECSKLKYHSSIDADSGIYSPNQMEALFNQTSSSPEYVNFNNKNNILGHSQSLRVAPSKPAGWHNFVPPLHLRISDDEVSVDDSGVSLSPTVTESGMWKPPAENTVLASTFKTDSIIDNKTDPSHFYNDELIKQQHRDMIRPYLCNEEFVDDVPSCSAFNTSLDATNDSQLTSDYNSCRLYEDDPHFLVHQEYEDEETLNYNQMTQSGFCFTDDNDDVLNNETINTITPLKSALKSGKSKAEKPKVTFKLGFFI